LKLKDQSAIEERIKFVDLDRGFLPLEADEENDSERIRAIAAFEVDRLLLWDETLQENLRRMAVTCPMM
jgi:hypothetical protein